MADITSPIALDESFNTTETTPRNIADVVADETGDLVTQAQAIVTKLQGIISAVKPNANDIPLDPIAGMSADDVQEGISELKGTLTNNTLQQPTEGTNVLVADGGYCKVGNIVVVNIRFKAIANISAGSIIATNLPKPAYKNGMNYVQIYLSASKIGFIDSNGNLYLSAGVNLTQDEIVFAHTVYMTY